MGKVQVGQTHGNLWMFSFSIYKVKLFAYELDEGNSLLTHSLYDVCFALGKHLSAEDFVVVTYRVVLNPLLT